MARSATCHVGTRKGLFTVARGASGWSVSRVSFLGDNCTLAVHDPRNDSLFATLNHGHFGVKLHRSRDGGDTWTEIGAPAYPPMPDGYVPKMTFSGKPIDWTLRLIWALALGGNDRSERALVRHDARRSVQLRRWRRFMDPEPIAAGRPAS